MTRSILSLTLHLSNLPNISLPILSISPPSSSCINYFPWQDCTLQPQSQCCHFLPMVLHILNFGWRPKESIYFLKTPPLGLHRSISLPLFNLLQERHYLDFYLGKWKQQAYSPLHCQKYLLLRKSRNFLSMQTNSYLCLPAKWTGACTTVYLAPETELPPIISPARFSHCSFSYRGRHCSLSPLCWPRDSCRPRHWNRRNNNLSFLLSNPFQRPCR